MRFLDLYNFFSFSIFLKLIKTLACTIQINKQFYVIGEDAESFYYNYKLLKLQNNQL